VFTKLTGIALALLLACVPAVLAGPATNARQPIGDKPIDLLMTHGQIRTSSGWAEALAIRNGVIIATGSTSAMEAMRSRTTKVLNLAGDTVLPGLHDTHVHPIFAGLGSRKCVIPAEATLQDTLERVKACVAKQSAGAWVTGREWDVSALGSVPHRAQLDAIAPNNPVLLEDQSAHSYWANSKALALAGVTRDTPNPAGGIIERDATGEPTGILRESAAELVQRHVPAPSDQELRSALTWSLQKMLSFGITSFTEAALGFSAGVKRELETYAALADSGVLKQRTRLCLTWEAGSDLAESAIVSRNQYARERLSPDCVKIILDGVPTDGHTAAMLEPYQGSVPGRDDEASRRGLLVVSQAVLNDAVTRFDRMGLTVKFHAAGDASVRAALNAIAATRDANGFSGLLHDVGHCPFVAKEDVPRARALGATFEVSPYLWSPSSTADSITTAVGESRVSRVWPVRELLDSGALVVPGSDWSVVPSVSPWIGIETLVTREKPGGSSTSFGKGEAISLEQALDMFTVNSARQAGAANKVGRIEPGMVADLIVVDRNPFRVPITQVHQTTVKMVFINGDKVFDVVSSEQAALH
jgi:predicted amidohydrolase YtcJ